jgi:hypothetical protein
MFDFQRLDVYRCGLGVGVSRDGLSRAADAAQRHPRLDEDAMRRELVVPMHSRTQWMTEAVDVHDHVHVHDGLRASHDMPYSSTEHGRFTDRL